MSRTAWGLRISITSLNSSAPPRFRLATWRWLPRVVAASILAVAAHQAAAADWPDHERLTRDQIVAALAAARGAPVSFYAKNLSELDLSGPDKNPVATAPAPPRLAVGAPARRTMMSVQCVSCHREFFNDPGSRPLPWCPSCGGNLKASPEAAAAHALADLSPPSLSAGDDTQPVPKAVSGAVTAAPDLQPQNAPLRLDDLGAVPAPTSPEEFAAILKRDGQVWGKLIREKNIRAD